MARAKSSGAGIYVALVLLGIGFMTCLIVAVMLYTRVASADQAAADADQTLRKFVSRTDEGAADIVGMLGEPERGAVVSQLREENMQLKRYIADAADADLSRIRTEIQSANIEEGVSLLREIARLKAELANSTNRVDELTQALAAADRRADAAEEGNRELTAEYERVTSQLQAEVAALRNSQSQYQSQVESQRQTLQEQLGTTRAELNQQLADVRSELSQALDDKAQLEARLRSLYTDREQTVVGRVDPSTLPDGEVVALLMDEDLVYIDRGSNHRVLLGLTFQVFDRVPGIVANADGEYKGKAKLEVVQVNENSSVARVVERSRNATIGIGDVISNPVYDPNMTFKFYVFGEFDIDGVGQATVSDRRRLETMITQWGGVVVDRRQPGEDHALTYDVDFLVLGVEPDIPPRPDDSVTDPVILNAYSAALERYTTYQSLVQEAETLSVPVLNQNRFLTMVGYYQR